MLYKESEKLELKSSFSEWKEIIKTLAGFANKKGGMVVIGVDDNVQPLGMQIRKGTIEDLSNKIKANTDPVLYPSINVKTFGLGEIVEISVASSDNKPVFAFERAYTRVGKTTQKLSTTEVRTLIKKYTLPDIDEQKMSEKINISKFNQKFVKKYPEYFKKSIKNAIYWAFIEKNKLFHNAIIKAALFKGDIPVDFIDEQEFDRSLVFAPDMIMKFIRRHINKQIKITEKAKHDEVWDYPLEALREAIMNAIVHRDYTDSGNIQIRIFDDRLEIWSPGLLPKEIDIDNLYKNNRSVPRNKLLMEIFHKVGLIENWGTGFYRMREWCRENGNNDPKFEHRGEALITTFFKKKAVSTNGGINGGINGGVKSIVTLIEKKSGINAKEIADELSMAQRTVERQIRKLRDKNKIEYRGSSKTGGYFIIKK